MASSTVDELLARLTLQEKCRLLSGKNFWQTADVPRLGIPSITTSDGPHGLRGTSFFNGPRACLLPAATAMGATFDTELMRNVGELLGREARSREVHVLLAPTVCIQRSPLIGRGFEAFSEDPILSGAMASEYIAGIQSQGVSAAIKHFAAHDQSTDSIEDDVRASERTLREVHLLPFQLAIKNAGPWSVMAAYHKINGLHTSEDPWLLDGVLRHERGWSGLVMSDWGGTYSCAEAVNAGLDLEMPGPSRWRGFLLEWSVRSGKVPRQILDTRVRNVLDLVQKVRNTNADDEGRDTLESRQLCRKVAADSIVLLKNNSGSLPLSLQSRHAYGLIGDHWQYPSASGGGSADLQPYYISNPLKAFQSAAGDDNCSFEPGAFSHRFTPTLNSSVTVPGSSEPGYLVEWFSEEPKQGTTPVETTTTTQAQMFFLDSIPKALSHVWYARVSTQFTADKTMKFKFGLSVSGRARLYVDGSVLIDQWSQQPPKDDATPMFNMGSTESCTELQVEEGKTYRLVAIMQNVSVIPGVGPVEGAGIRIGGCESVDPQLAIKRAVALAQSVDIPIILTGLSSDWEFEASDRMTLALPPGVDDLIREVLNANSNTIVITQSGLPITMPWLEEANTLVHAWYGGQEVGNSLVDVLFGRRNPSGRLSVTFPKRLEDNPAYLTFGKADKQLYYGEGVFVGHRYYEKTLREPLFYFGHGLSYTRFTYSNLVVPDVYIPDSEHKMRISVDVKNVGVQDGAETVQLYISDCHCSITRPRKELKGFAKVWLEKGGQQTVNLSLDKYALSFWSEAESKWMAEAGEFIVIIAQSANPQDEILRKHFRLPANFTWSGI